MVDILINVDHPEGAAKYTELHNALSAAQIPFDHSEEGDDFVISVDDRYETQVMNATMALGIDIVDYEDDMDLYDAPDVEGSYRVEAVSVEDVIDQVVEGQTPQEALGELIIPYYFGGKAPKKKEAVRAKSNKTTKDKNSLKPTQESGDSDD